MGSKNKTDQNLSNNKVLIKGLSFSLLLVVSSVVSIFTQTNLASAVGSMYLTPANPSVVQNSSVTVSLRINPTTPVTVVEATVDFTAAALQFVGIDSSGSPFDASVQQSVSGSNVKIVRAKLDPAGVGSDALIANITFKALPSSGSSSLTISAANAAYNGTYTNPSVGNAAVSFTSVGCPTGQVGAPPSCTAPPKTPSTTTKNTTTTPSNSAPKPSAPNEAAKLSLQKPTIATKSNQYTTFGVTATTNVAAQVYMVYGTTKDKLNLQTEPTASATTHTVTVAKGITPGSLLFYKLVARDGQSTQESTVQSVTLKGMSIKVALLDKNIKKITNQKITLMPTNKEATSDDNGSVVFNDLMPGDYTVQITNDGTTHQQHIAVVSNIVTIDGAQTSEQQLKAVIFDGYESPVLWSPVVVWYIGGAIIIIAVLALLGYRSWRKNGLVRQWYGKLRDYRVNKRLNGSLVAQTAATATTQSQSRNEAADDRSSTNNYFDNNGGAS